MYAPSTSSPAQSARYDCSPRVAQSAPPSPRLLTRLTRVGRKLDRVRPDSVNRLRGLLLKHTPHGGLISSAQARKRSRAVLGDSTQQQPQRDETTRMHRAHSSGRLCGASGTDGAASQSTPGRLEGRDEADGLQGAEKKTRARHRGVPDLPARNTEENALLSVAESDRVYGRRPHVSRGADALNDSCTSKTIATHLRATGNARHAADEARGDSEHNVCASGGRRHRECAQLVVQSKRRGQRTARRM